ncbi:hypothetical protein [Dyella sp.]|uniref:hypothetical protein n=1 Tax=Dyella sp. TaxID=1869338 RepID=UPI003F7F72EC
MSEILKFLEDVGSKADLRYAPRAYFGSAAPKNGVEYICGQIASKGECTMIPVVMPFVDGLCS